MRSWTFLSITVRYGLYLFLFSIPYVTPYPTQDADTLQAGGSFPNPVNLTALSDANLGQPAPVEVDIRYVPNGVYFSEKDFYLTIIYMVADEANSDINNVEFHSTWPTSSSLVLEFRAIRGDHGIPILSIKTTLEIIEVFARKVTMEGNRLAEVFFYPKWKDKALGVGRLFHNPNVVPELSPNALSPGTISNTSLSVESDTFDLSIRLHYNAISRQHPRRDIFWFMIEGILAVAPFSSRAPCRALTRQSSGLTITIKPGRSTRGLFVNGIVVHLYKALAIAMAEASPQGWYGDIVFEIFRDRVPIATGSLTGGNVVGAVDGVAVDTS